MILVQVDAPVLEDTRDPAVSDVKFVVHEGAVYRIGTVHVTGDLLAEESEYLKRFWSSKKGDPFNRSAIAADLDRIKDFHLQRGFEVSVEPETRIDADKHTVDITLRVGH